MLLFFFSLDYISLEFMCFEWSRSREKIDAGLPESMTEGRVKKAFSQFGEVIQGEIFYFMLFSSLVCMEVTPRRNGLLLRCNNIVQ